MTGKPRFTPAASLALGGPGWLVERRRRAAELLGDVAWPTASEEIWRYSRINDFDLDRYRPMTEAGIGEVGVENAPGGGVVAAEAGERSGLVVVRDGRVVHHELEDDLASKGVIVCGIATCDGEDVGRWLGMCSDASPDAFTLLHDAFLAGGAFARGCGRRQADRRPALVRRRRARIVPAHARRGRGAERGDRPRSLRLPGTSTTSSTAWWRSSSVTTRT